MATMVRFSAAVLLLLLLHYTEVVLGTITVPPVDNNVCYGGVSTFYCKSVDRNDVDKVQWSVNDTDVTDEVAITRGITIDSNITNGTSTIYITGLPVNEGIITCIFVTDTIDVSAASAIFTVTEIPSVNIVTIVFNDTLMSITWSPPSCIPVNHSYIVSITNDSTTVTNTTTELYYTIPVSPCSSNYTVSITVIDVGFTQYQSIPTIEYDEKSNTQEITITVQNRSKVSFIGPEDAFITIYYQINPHSQLICPSTIVQAIATIHSIIPSGYYTNNLVIDNLIKSFDNSTGMGSYTIGPIKKRFIGCVNLTTLISDDIVNFSTYNVQDFTIQLLQNGTTNITCYFAQNSSADGCQVKLVSMESSNETFFTINKTSLVQDVITEYMYMNIAPGEYGVSVHDIVNNVVNSHSSLEENLTFSVPDPVISSSVVTVVKSTMETSMDSVLSTSLIEVTTSNPVGKKQSDTVPVVVIVGAIVGIIILVCVVIISMIALYVRYKRIRSKRIVILHSEIAYNQKNTAESNSYIVVHSVKQDTVDIGQSNNDVDNEIEQSNNSVMVDPDNGHHTSLIEPDDDNDDDFQYQDAFLQQSSTDPNTEEMTPLTAVSSQYSTVESSSSAAPLLPPRSSTQTAVAQHQVIQQVLKEETHQILSEGTQNNEEINQLTVSSYDSMWSSHSTSPLIQREGKTHHQHHNSMKEESKQVASSSSTVPLLPPRLLLEPLEEDTEKDSEQKNVEDTILPIPSPDVKPLIRNSDGHIIPSGSKLDQSQYAVVELKPKEKRPKKRVNDGTHVYATFFNKDPSKPAVPLKQRTLITNETNPNHCGNDNNEQKFIGVEETQQGNTIGAYFSGVSITPELHGPTVASGSNKVIGNIEYDHASSNIETGAVDQHYNNTVTSSVIQIPEMVNEDDEREVFYTDSISGAINIFQSFSGNSDHDCYSKKSCCDSEQVDDWNNEDDILTEMVYTRTTFHCDVIVSSYQVDRSIEISDASFTKKIQETLKET